MTKVQVFDEKKHWRIKTEKATVKQNKEVYIWAFLYTQCFGGWPKVSGVSNREIKVVQMSLSLAPFACMRNPLALQAKWDA